MFGVMCLPELVFAGSDYTVLTSGKRGEAGIKIDAICQATHIPVEGIPTWSTHHIICHPNYSQQLNVCTVRIPGVSKLFFSLRTTYGKTEEYKGHYDIL